MDTQYFQLMPFGNKTPTPDIKISGDISRQASALSIVFDLSGDLSQIELSGSLKDPTRSIGLWKTTCFEIFIGLKGSPKYWEVNLSPTGDWNVFSFSSYRNRENGNRLIEADGFSDLPFTSDRQADRYTLCLQRGLDALFSTRDALEIGISAVVKSLGNASLSFWSLNHKGDRADFHQRETFTLCM